MGPIETFAHALFLAICTMGGIYFSIPLISDLAKNLALVHELGIEVPMFPVGPAYERDTRVSLCCLEILTPSMTSVHCPAAPGGNHRRQTSILFKSEVQLSLPVASSGQQESQPVIDSECEIKYCAVSSYEELGKVCYRIVSQHKLSSTLSACCHAHVMYGFSWRC